MESNIETGRVIVDRETSGSWVQVAQASRILLEVLDGTPSVTDSSPLGVTREYFPDEPVDTWCRSYLSAALEHLVMWADFVAPLKLHPEAELHHTQRPAQTLARAALESASQAVWILASDNPREMARRHVALVLADLDEQRKAALDPAVKLELKLKRQTFLDVLADANVEVRAPTYLSMVTFAAAQLRSEVSSSELGDAAHVERLWRASAGSAHGKMWPSIELRVTIDLDGKSYSFPDASAMSAILVLAKEVTSYGVGLYVERAGHGTLLDRRLRQAAASLYARIPKIPGAAAVLPEPPTQQIR